MYVRRGREGPGHDPLVCTLVVLGWLVGARFARVRWLRAEAERQRLRAELRHAGATRLMLRSSADACAMLQYTCVRYDCVLMRGSQ